MIMGALSPTPKFLTIAPHFKFLLNRAYTELLRAFIQKKNYTVNRPYNLLFLL